MREIGLGVLLVFGVPQMPRFAKRTQLDLRPVRCFGSDAHHEVKNVTVSAGRSGLTQPPNSNEFFPPRRILTRHCLKMLTSEKSPGW